MKLIKARIKGEKPKLPSAEAARRKARSSTSWSACARASRRIRKQASRARPAKRARPAACKNARTEEAAPRRVMSMRRLLATILLIATSAAACRETGDVQVTSIKFDRRKRRPAGELKADSRHARERIPAVVAQAVLRSPRVRSRRQAHRGVLRRSRLSPGKSRRRRRRAERREGQGRHHR